MTFRLPLENPCAPNSASAAASTARRRSSGSRSQVAVGMSPLARRSPPSYYDHRSYDQWSCQGEGLLSERVKIVIIGAGFAGLGMGIRLKQAGESDFVILERAADVGGTWRDNSYPGCAVDVQSHLYSFSFAPNPEWSQVYSPQAEIWDYIKTVG